MTKFYAVIRQENGELFIYRGNEVFPELRRGNTPECITYRRDWFATAEKIKVAEGEKEKFKKWRYDNNENALHYLHKEVEKDLNEGFEISCYEVRVTTRDAVSGGQSLNTVIREPLAYFKDDRASEKETEKTASEIMNDGFDRWVKSKGNHASDEATGEIRSCPCTYLDEPCKVDCTCKNAFSSSGCDYCCTYGSFEQRQSQAVFLSKKLSDRPHENTSLDPKEHAIQFARWAIKQKNEIDYSMTWGQIYDIFLSRK